MCGVLEGVGGGVEEESRASRGSAEGSEKVGDVMPEPGLKNLYFVLKPGAKMKGDVYAWASRAAMEAYAEKVEFVNPQLAEDLQEWVSREDAIDELKWSVVRKSEE